MFLKKFFLLFFCVVLVFVFFSVSKTQVACAYDQGSCGNGSICYTGPDGPDVAPGYACGTDPSVSTNYVYGVDNNPIRKGHVVACNAGGIQTNGLCCDKGTPLPQLPPHDGYVLEASYTDTTLPGDCALTSICYTGTRPASLTSGQQCGNLPGWYYGTTGGSNPTVPACGTGVCCDAVGSTPIPPNPCPSQNGICTNVDTALGNIDVSGPGGFIKVAFGVLLSLSGGIALLLIIFSGYRIMAAQGDPEKIKEAREMLTSAIIGLLFMIFSVSILQILGVDILRIPGFGK